MTKKDKPQVTAFAARSFDALDDGLEQDTGLEVTGGEKDVVTTEGTELPVVGKDQEDPSSVETKEDETPPLVKEEEEEKEDVGDTGEDDGDADDDDDDVSLEEPSTEVKERVGFSVICQGGCAGLAGAKVVDDELPEGTFEPTTSKELVVARANCRLAKIYREAPKALLGV